MLLKSPALDLQVNFVRMSDFPPFFGFVSPSCFSFVQSHPQLLHGDAEDLGEMLGT